MLDLFIEFWLLKEPYVIWVLVGSVILGITTGTLGTFAFLQKRGLLGDVLSHASLPGVTTVFLFFATVDPVFVLCGAAVSSFLGIFMIDTITKNTKIKEDTALAIVLSLFFSLGIFQLTIIQKSGSVAQAGLNNILFGQAASLVKKDVVFLTFVALLLLSFVTVFLKPIRLIIFDRNFARTIGLKVRFYEALLSLSIVLAVVIGLQLVGVILMAALLVTPAASARYWTDKLGVMLLLSALFGGLSGAFGANISYISPGLSTGPWIVVFLTLLFVVSLLFAPKRGVFVRFLSKRAHVQRVNIENVLHTFFKICEKCGETHCKVSKADLLSYRRMSTKAMDKILNSLLGKRLIKPLGEYYCFTSKGYRYAQLITRRHRLFELYLSRKISVDREHVHHIAEDAEHVLSKDLEHEVLAQLDSVTIDPHGSIIPEINKCCGRQDVDQ